MKVFDFFILSLRTKRDYLFISIIVFFSLILSLLEIAGVGALLPFLNVIQDPGLIFLDANYKYVCGLLRINSSELFIFYFGILLIAIYLLHGISNMAVTYMQNYFAYKKQTDLSTELLSCYLNAPYEFHLDANSATLLKNINVETANIMLFLQQSLSLALEFIILLFLTSFLFYLNPKITAILVVSALTFHFGVSRTFLDKAKLLGDRRENIQSKAFRYAQQALFNVKNIIINNKPKYFIRMFESNLKDIIKVGSYFRTLTVLPKAVVETMIIIGAIVFFLLKLRTTGFDPKLIPLIGVYGFAIYRIVPSMNKITTILVNMKFLKASVDIVGDEIKRLKVVDRRDETKIPKTGLEDRILIRNLTFRYSPNSDYVYKDMNLDIYKKEKVLIIGDSGSGKSTFIDLLVGLLKPEAGDILYDDVSIRDLDVSKLIGYLPQRLTLLDTDITSNIAFGEEQKGIDKEKLLVTLKKVNLRELAKSLNKLVGEDGIKLSGGQRQRIGVARIFYRDRDVIFLDEFSSALDRDNETMLIKEIMDVFSDKTVIAVTHKTYLCPYFDKVYKKTQYSLTEMNQPVEIEG